METVKKKDFVEIKYTGYSNGNVFDSNIDEDLKKLDPKGKPRELVVIIGEGMVVPGLDKALEGKEIGKEYEVGVSAKEGFGERKREMVKTIPLKIFTEKQINPYPGMVLAMDDSLVRIITISGARVMTDFNNPLAGKDLVYKFKIVRKIDDEKERAKILLEFILRFVPEHEVTDKEVIVKGPKILEKFVTAFKEKFKDILGKELNFVLEEQKPKKEEEKKEEQKEKAEDKSEKEESEKK